MSEDHLAAGQDIIQIREVVRNIFPGTPMTVERVREGGSTYVYRLNTESERFYLRVLPEEGASFLPEVEVHRRLRVFICRLDLCIMVLPWGKVVCWY